MAQHHNKLQPYFTFSDENCGFWRDSVLVYLIFENAFICKSHSKNSLAEIAVAKNFSFLSDWDCWYILLPRSKIAISEKFIVSEIYFFKR